MEDDDVDDSAEATERENEDDIVTATEVGNEDADPLVEFVVASDSEEPFLRRGSNCGDGIL